MPQPPEIRTHQETYVYDGPDGVVAVELPLWTTTDNGVPLCWHHHRTLEHSGWKIRMRRGVPEVCGPVGWDPYQRRRPVRPPAVLQPA